MKIRVGSRVIGENEPTFIVAEMSGNHGGSFEKAIEIVRAVKRAGADAIKLQTYTADTITLKSDKDDFLIAKDSPWAVHKTLWSLYNEAYTPWEWHSEIFNEARNLGLEVFSSPFDETAVDLLEDLGTLIYKIASPEITNIPLLERVARTGKPIIISSGLGDLSDIEYALSTLRNSGAKEIIVLKCTTSYPAPPEESNLRTIPDIKTRFNVLSGLSDHTLGTAAPVAAAAIGADLIEKHFINDQEASTVDSFFSSGEAEFAQMVKDIRFVNKAMGKIEYDISASALPSLKVRSSLYVSATIRTGECFTSANIRAVRPAWGLHPKYYKQILGRKAKCDLTMGDRLSWEVIE